MLCMTECNNSATPIRGGGYKMRDPPYRLQRARGCSAGDGLATVRNITPPRDPTARILELHDRKICPPPKTSRICKLLQELYHNELVSQKLKQGAIKPSLSATERELAKLKEQTNSALQEITTLREAISYCDQQAVLLQRERRNLSEEIKRAEERHKCDMDISMNEYVFYRKEIDSFHEEADVTVIDMKEIAAEVEKWREICSQWKADTIALEPDYCRLTADIERLERKRRHLEQTLDHNGTSLERMNNAIEMCEDQYNEGPVRKGVNQSELAMVLHEKGLLTFDLQRTCKETLLIKHQLDDALTHRYLAEDDSNKMRTELSRAERTYPVQGISNSDAYSSVAEQQLQVDRTDLQLKFQQAEAVLISTTEEKLLRKKAQFDKQQIEIILKLDPEGDFIMEEKRLQNHMVATMERHGSFQDDLFKINNSTEQSTLELREKEKDIEEAEAYMGALKVKIIQQQESMQSMKKRASETFQMTVTDLRQQVQVLLKQAEEEFDTSRPCPSVLDLR